MPAWTVPYKYLVTIASSLPGRLVPAPLRVDAWSAEDAIVQAEVQLRIRSNPESPYRVSNVEPYVDAE